MNTPTHRNVRPACARVGFTLIEIMTATMIMVFILMGVFTITGRVLNAFNRANAQLSANAEARFAMDTIARDIESAIIRNDKPTIMWLASARQTVNGTSGEFYVTNAAWLRFFTASSPDRDMATAGDVNGVAYRLTHAWQLPTTDPGDQARHAFALYREYYEADYTFTNVLGNAIDSYPAASADLRSSLMASHVVDLAFTFGYEDTSGTSREVTVSAANGNNIRVGAGTDFVYGTGVTNGADLRYIQISMSILTDEGVREFRAWKQTGTTPAAIATIAGGGTDWDKFRRKYSYTYSRRIPVTTGL